ncbi:hypothetical protein JCM3765_007704 [Sporobolomyces pararoseus]
MMQTPSPTPPSPRRSSNSTPTPSTSSSAQSNSTSFPIPSSSYTNSLPSTYRRSSFPVSPAIQLTTSSSGSTTAMIPPGLSFERRGCRDDDDYEKATGSKAPFYPNYSTMRSQSVESSRNNSMSSLSGSEAGSGSVGWLANSGRSWSLNSGSLVSEEKKKREAVKGWEDPALAAARRALWADDDDVNDQNAPGGGGCSSTAGKDEISLLREKNRKSGSGDNEEAIEFDEDEDEEEEQENEIRSSDDDDWDTTPPALLRPPCHSTLSPGPSCLRSSSSRSSLSPSPRFSQLSLSQDSSSSASTPPLTSSSHSIERGVSPSPSSSQSNSSSCSTSLTTTPSIRFSVDPPKTLPTYSKIDYERKGDLPVEKLSIREWIELQGVREAVGVWSGKIAKWEEGVEGDSPSNACPSSTTSSTTPTPTNSTISNSNGNGGRPSLSLAALTGVVTVSKSTPNSPTSATSSPRLGSASLPLHSS